MKIQASITDLSASTLNTAGQLRTRHSLMRLSFGIVYLMILFSTIFRGGNRGVALVVLDWLAVVAGLGFAWLSIFGASAPKPHSIFDRVAVWLLILSPLWLAIWQLGVSISAVPTAAAFALLAGLPIAVCLVGGWWASDSQAAVLRKLWIGVAITQALFGLSQLAGPVGLHFGLVTSDTVIGTFASKNTYANLLVMAIPLAVFQLFSSLGHNRQGQGNRATWGWGAAVFVLVVTVLLTTSRTGIVTGLVVLLLSAILLAPRKATSAPASRWGAWSWAAGLVALVVVALMAGGLDWAARFDADRLSIDYDVRALMRSAAAGAAWSGLPLGSGLGSFPWVSSAFQPPEMGRYWFDLAHNDYFQLLAETGLAGALLIAAVLWLYVRRGVFWLRRLAAGRAAGASTREALAALAALAGGLGLLAFGLHAWVDYPFHIPANAMMAATLFGLMLRSERSDRLAVQSRPRSITRSIAG